jgi:hypothetical protein
MQSRLAMLALAVLMSCACLAADNEAKKPNELMMSLDDKFVVAETDDWSVSVEKYMPLRVADVQVKSKQGYVFDMMLYFKCDTPDLAQFDSPAKIERSVRFSSKPYLSGAVEKTLTLKKLTPNGWYGCYVVLTDKEAAAKTELRPGEFKYITRGMIRLSPDSALGFSLMTNDVDSPDYKKMLDFICGFAKPKQ